MKTFSVENHYSEKEITFPIETLPARSKNTIYKIGRTANKASLKLVRDIEKVARSSSSVLITGETGTGKEVAANAIHNQSDRKNYPFIAVNCGALPAQLIQSELFGHEKGAFTGAHQRRIGQVEQAHKGTLFLDEIGDLPLELQATLLRFLQERNFVRLGGTEQISVDIRIIAATHVNLELAIEKGTFREDLYHRLNVLPLSVPTLSDRYDEIMPLALLFLEEYSKNNQTIAEGFSEESIGAMLAYKWPGNVRELKNRVHRAITMTDNKLITPEDLGLDRRVVRPHIQTLDEARRETEKHLIQFTLRRTNKKITKAAQVLGVTRATLYRLIDKHKINLS